MSAVAELDQKIADARASRRAAMAALEEAEAARTQALLDGDEDAVARDEAKIADLKRQADNFEERAKLLEGSRQNAIGADAKPAFDAAMAALNAAGEHDRVLHEKFAAAVDALAELAGEIVASHAATENTLHAARAAGKPLNEWPRVYLPLIDTACLQALGGLHRRMCHHEQMRQRQAMAAAAHAPIETKVHPGYDKSLKIQPAAEQSFQGFMPVRQRRA